MFISLNQLYFRIAGRYLKTRLVSDTFSSGKSLIDIFQICSKLGINFCLRITTNAHSSFITMFQLLVCGSVSRAGRHSQNSLAYTVKYIIFVQ
jgi:hypothetical protein